MAHMEGTIMIGYATQRASHDHMTLLEFPRSRCGKSAGSIAFTKLILSNICRVHIRQILITNILFFGSSIEYSQNLQWTKFTCAPLLSGRVGKRFTFASGCNKIDRDIMPSVSMIFRDAQKRYIEVGKYTLLDNFSIMSASQDDVLKPVAIVRYSFLLPQPIDDQLSHILGRNRSWTTKWLRFRPKLGSCEFLSVPTR